MFYTQCGFFKRPKREALEKLKSSDSQRESFRSDSFSGDSSETMMPLSRPESHSDHQFIYPNLSSIENDNEFHDAELSVDLLTNQTLTLGRRNRRRGRYNPSYLHSTGSFKGKFVSKGINNNNNDLGIRGNHFDLNAKATENLDHIELRVRRNKNAEQGLRNSSYIGQKLSQDFWAANPPRPASHSNTLKFNNEMYLEPVETSASDLYLEPIQRQPNSDLYFEPVEHNADYYLESSQTNRFEVPSAPPLSNDQFSEPLDSLVTTSGTPPPSFNNEIYLELLETRA